MAIPSLSGFVAGEKVTAAKLTQHTKTAIEESVYYKPFCSLWDVGVSSWPPGWQTVGFDSIYEDTDGMADLANRRMIVKTAGLYRITGQISFQQHATGSRRLSIVGGSWIAASQWIAAPATDVCKLNASGYARLNVGQLITLSCWQNSGGTLNSSPLDGPNIFSAEWVSL